MPVLTSGQQERKSKQRKIRNSEYYDMEGTFDRLYAESKKDKTFNHLMEIIESEENIKLAYRTIKKNTGSDTSGVDKRTIADLAKLSEEEYVHLEWKYQSPMERPDRWEFQLSWIGSYSNVFCRSWSRYVKQNSVRTPTGSARTVPLRLLLRNA